MAVKFLHYWVYLDLDNVGPNDLKYLNLMDFRFYSETHDWEGFIFYVLTSMDYGFRMWVA